MLRAYFLGDLRFCNDGREIADLATRKSGVLLAGLMLSAGKKFSREQIADMLWESHPPADPAKAVRHEIWAVRAALAKFGLPADELLDTEGTFVAFNPAGPCWLDVNEFEGAVATAMSPEADGNTAAPDLDQLEHAVGLYRGDLLPGLYYSDWFIYAREALRDRFLTALERLMAAHEQAENWDQAILFGKRLLAADPLLEYVHRSLMRCYDAKGARPRALKQFEACRRMLAEAFSEPVAPMAETAALYEKIRDDGLPPNDALTPLGPPPPRPQGNPVQRPAHGATTAGNTIAELDAVRSGLRAADHRIDRIIRILGEG